MQIFFLQPLSPNKGKLNQEEARHCIKVLRHKPGDSIHTIDGKGNYYPAQIESVNPGEVWLTLGEAQKNWGETPFEISLAISPLAKKDRFEWMLEKAVELGVNHIYPIQCKHTHQNRLPKEGRMDKILLTAVKQSKRSSIPKLHPLLSFSDFIHQEHGTYKFIAWCESQNAIQNYSVEMRKSTRFSLLIGPEGDFSAEEVHAAEKQGFHPVSFGTNRLRSETAGLFALSYLKSILAY